MYIDSYQFGKIVIDGKCYTADLIIYPDRVKDNWWRKEGHQLCLDDILEVLEKKEVVTSPETIIVGTGAVNCLRVLPETEKYIRAQGIKLTILPTGKAVETYNQLVGEGEKNIFACLHLTC